jgi:integrase
LSLPFPEKEHRDAQDEEKRLLGAAYQDQGLVFARAGGSVVDPWNYGRAVSDIVRRAGVKSITLHGLRDTHASLLAQAGVPIEVVSKRLGHSDIGVTYSRYIDVYTDRDADAAARFGKLVG